MGGHQNTFRGEGKGTERKLKENQINERITSNKTEGSNKYTLNIFKRKEFLG
jgi:hypothetical protein